MKTVNIRISLLAAALSVAGIPLAHAADTTIASGQTVTKSLSVSGTDNLTVESDGSLSVSNDNAVKWKDASTNLVIDNFGIIESTESEGRVINDSGSATSPRTITLNNYAGGIIQSQNDAFRINIDVTGGTVTVNNAGTILSSVDGQAIDFDAINSAGTAAAQVNINNLAGGVIQANGADAIRPGEGAVVTNAGLIYSDGVIGDKNDGVDWQAHSGTVINLAGGVISGQRHGITSDTDVNVYNAAGGTIIGRNGSGVGSDGNGSVVNYGTITGAYVGTGNGDGDGVDIDFYGVVDNYGIIQATGAAGVDSYGLPNTSEGIAITGGGTITNHAGATISSVQNAIDAEGGNIVIVNQGLIEAPNGISLGDGNDTITNSGTIMSTYAIAMGGGDDTLIIQKGSVINGIVDGGTGTNLLHLEDSAVFDTATNFSILQVDGSATLTGNNTIPHTVIDAGGRLQLGNGGTAGFVSGDIDDEGALAVNRSDAITLSGTISGGGDVDQVGTGTTVLTGTNTYTGSTNVQAGTLQAGAAGAFSSQSAFTVASGATLNAAGYAPSIARLNNAGTVIVGNGSAASQLIVNGAYVGHQGTIVLDANLAAGLSDKLVLNGPNATATGNTFLAFNMQGGYGKATTGNGIEVVSALNGASTGHDAFALASGTVLSGAYAYKLYKGDTTGQGNDWYLRSSERSSAALYSAIPGFAGQLTQLDTLHERVGDSVRSGDDSRAWVRVFGRTGDHEAGSFESNGPSYGYSLSGLQAGVDLLGNLDPTADQARGHVAGVYLSAAHANGRVDGLDPAISAGSLDGNAYSVGIYWTQRFASGTYIDAVAQASRYSHLDAAGIDGAGSVSTQGNGYSVSIEAGHSFELSNQVAIEPEAQVIGSRVDMDGVSDTASMTTFNRPWEWTARIGGRLIFNQSNGGKLWANVDVRHAFGDASKTVISTLDGDYPTTISAKPGATWGEVGVNYSAQIGKQLGVYTGLAVTVPTGGRGELSIATNLGLKYSW